MYGLCLVVFYGLLHVYFAQSLKYDFTVTVKSMRLTIAVVPWSKYQDLSLQIMPLCFEQLM